MNEMILETLTMAMVVYLATRLLLRPRRTKLEFSATQNTDSPSPCACGSHHPQIGPAKHYYTIEEWDERQKKFANRTGKRMTKLSRYIRAHDNLALKIMEMGPQELQSAKGQEKVVLLQKLRQRCQDEEVRIARKIGKKWMLCRSCWNVSRRYVHDEAIQDKLCYMRDEHADKAHATYFHLAKLVGEEE